MVDKILGLPSGHLPAVMNGKAEEISVIKEFYKSYEKGRLFIHGCVDLMHSTHEDEGFMRTFMLFLFATMLCPRTGNYINIDYLHIPVDISLLGHYDWASQVLKCLMKEIRKYQGFSEEQKNADFLIGECLPILTIAYMDHMHLSTAGLKVHAVNYSMSRICHVTIVDIDFAANVDHNKLCITCVTYGARPFHKKSEIPYYSETKEEEAVLQESASLDEWMKQSSSSSQTQQMPSNIQEIVNKYNLLWEKNLQCAMATFSKSMSDMHSKHMTSMAYEISKVLGTNSVNDCVGTSHVVVAEGLRTEEADDANVLEGLQKASNDAKNSEDGSKVDEDIDINIKSPSTRVATPVDQQQHDFDAPSFSLFNKDDPKYLDSLEYGATAEIEAVIEDIGIVSSPRSLAKNLVGSPLKVDISRGATSGAESSPRVPASSSPISTSPISIDGEHEDQSSGPSTHKKKTRKKRARKGKEIELISKKLKVSNEARDAYNAYVLTKLSKRSKKNTDLSPFVTIGGFYLSYDRFRNALKPRGELCNEVMAAWVEWFNDGCKGNGKYGSLVKKYAFSPIITGQLLMDTENFMPQTCLTMVSKINDDWKLAKLDVVSISVFLYL
ncbi:hypothetical protein ABZP36_033333 [Zizania latifolia]